MITGFGLWDWGPAVQAGRWSLLLGFGKGPGQPRPARLGPLKGGGGKP